MLVEQTNKSIYFPMLISEDKDGSIVDVEADEAEWKKLKNLDQKKKSVLVSHELPQKIRLLQEQFQLEDTSVGKISIFIRKIFFGELSLAECEAKIGSMLAVTGGGNPNQAKVIMEFIQKEILTIQPKPEVEEMIEEVKPQAVTIHMPLLQALSKYENLGNQLITGERIRVKSQAEPVRPSLLYWLKYYRDDIGVGHHDSVQRGQFLFRSENGRRLSAEERERLGLILKSVEEDFPLAIDTERQEIVFPVFQGVMASGAPQPPTVPVSARMMRSPAFVDNGADDERAKKFIPASNPVLQYSDAGRPDQSVAAQNAAGGLRMGRGMHFGNLEQAQAVPGEPGALSFSASHIFPAEKEVTEQSGAAKKMQTPSVQKSAQPPVLPSTLRSPVPPPANHNPFHIRPVSLGKGEARNQE